MLKVRPIEKTDQQAFFDLANLSGPGFTSLPDDEQLLKSRIVLSKESFERAVEEPGEEGYLLALEDTEQDHIIGTSAVKVGVGLSKPFFSYKLLSIAQISGAVDRRFSMDVMILVNEYAGATEVGTLFVHPDFRGGGSGTLIARSRYMLIATAPERFGDRVLSELRGMVSADGHSPFYEHLAKKFFDMEFSEVDHLTGVTDKQFISDLMPKYPIYVNLLPKEAQEVIGKTHIDGGGARRLLEKEGFRYNRVVDIFDAGPTLVAPKNELLAVRTSQKRTVKAGGAGQMRAIVSNERVDGFRACLAMITLSDDGETIITEQSVLDALNVASGDTIRFVEN